MAVATTIAAVGAAIATATVSQVAMTVALVGIGTTVIGGITGNKTMQKVGMGLSLAGTVLGIGGALTGTGGSAFFGDPPDTAGAASAFAPDAAGTAGNLATAAPSAMQHRPIDGTLGATLGAQPAAGWSDPNLNATLAGNMNQAGQVGAGTVLAPWSATPTPTPLTQTPPSLATSPIGMPPPPIDAAGLQQEALGKGIVQGTLNSVQPVTPATDIGDWWKKLDPNMKVAMAMTAGQGISGLASGYFAGASAEQKLELEKLINQQNQDQRQHYNRNNAYVPSIKFGAKPPGLLAAGQGGTA